MKHSFRYLPLILAAAIFALPFAYGQDGASFTRKELVAVSGDPLAKFFGATLEKLSLYAMTSDGFSPIPFQIDQRYRDGKELRYAYTGGDKAKVDPDPLFDLNDELVFWSGDAGTQVSIDKFPSGAQGIELALKDNLTGATGYVYLLSFQEAAPRCDRRYVKYDPKSDSIDALYYNLDFPDKYKIGFVDLAVKPIAGGDGRDIASEAKYRVALNAGGPLVQYELTNEEAHSKVQAWIDGPVRARRVVRNYVETWVWLGSTSHAESVYTPSGFSIEAPIIGPWPLKRVVGMKARWALELNENAKGMSFKSDKNPTVVVIDGASSEEERKMNYSPPEWILMTGKPGTILRRAGKLSKRPLYLDLYYMDNSAMNEDLERDPGQIGAIGFYIPYPGRRGWKARENIVEYYDVLPNYSDGDEQIFIERSKTPVRISAGEASESFPNSAQTGPQEWPAPEKARKDKPRPTHEYVGGEAPKTEKQVVPIVMASSDSGVGGGVGFMDTNFFDTGIRMGTLLVYTSKSYAIAEITLGSREARQGGDWAWNVYFGYHNRPVLDFYGLGNESLHEDRTNFFEEREKVTLWGMRRISGPLWLGAFVEPTHEFIGDGESEKIPNMFAPKYFPDIYGKGDWWGSRVGAFIRLDTRDDFDNPTKGGFYELEYYSLPDWMGDDAAFEYWNLDLRQFISLREHRKDVLALRLQASHAEGGPIPFFELAKAGSERTLRGYTDGRWRDRDMISLNTELRHNLWKAFDLNFYYDIGRVYGDIFQEGEHLGTDLRDAYGGGFRIQVPPDLVLRVDFGFSSTDSVFYLNFGQTF